MQKLQQMMVLTIVVILAVVAGGYFLLISPQHSKAADLRAKVDAEGQTSLSLQQQIQSLKQQALDLPSVQAQLAAIGRQIPQDASEPGLVTVLTQAAASAGVDLQTLDPGLPAPEVGTSTSATLSAKGAAAAAPAAYQVIPVKLTAVGTYFQLELFIHSLVHLPRAMRVAQITFAQGDPLASSDTTTPSAGTSATSTSPSSTGAAKLTAQISAQVFMAPSPASAPATGVTAHK